METQLDRHCIDVLHAEAQQDLLRKMVEFLEARGFSRASATTVTRHLPAFVEYQFIANASTSYVPEFEDLEAARLDPVSEHVSTHSAPLVLNQSICVKDRRGGLWVRRAPYGDRSAIAYGFHFPRGRSFLFDPDSDRGTVEDLHLFAAQTQVEAFELCLNYHPLPCELPTQSRSAGGAALDYGWDDGREDRAKLGFVGARYDAAASAGDAQVRMRYQVRGGSQGDQAGLDRGLLNRRLTPEAAFPGSETRQ